jgi:hypothetical protein
MNNNDLQMRRLAHLEVVIVHEGNSFASSGVVPSP